MAPGSRGWDVAMHRLTSVAHGLRIAVSHCRSAYGCSGAEQYLRQRVRPARTHGRLFGSWRQLL